MLFNTVYSLYFFIHVILFFIIMYVKLICNYTIKASISNMHLVLLVWVGWEILFGRKRITIRFSPPNSQCNLCL